MSVAQKIDKTEIDVIVRQSDQDRIIHRERCNPRSRVHPPRAAEGALRGFRSARWGEEGSSLPSSPRPGGRLIAAAGQSVLDRFFDRFTGFAGALLNAAQQLLLLAFSELEVVIRELSPFLFQFALGDVPVPFDFEFGHSRLFCFRFCSPPT